MTNIKIALYTLLAFAACVLLMLWSWKALLCLAIVVAFIAVIMYGLSGPEYEGYL